MELSAMDIIYYAFIVLVVIGGITAIVILCPKENKLREEKHNCYRFFRQDDRFVLSFSKPSLFESRLDKPVYVDKGPFDIDLLNENITGTDGKSYRAGVLLQLYLPESGAETAANYLYSILGDFSQESINANLTAELEKVFADCMKGYNGNTDKEKLSEAFRNNVIEKLAVYGFDLYSRPEISVAENK